MAFSGEASKNESVAKEKSLRDAESRITFIETAGKTLLRNVSLGMCRIPLFDTLK
jgi:hypothetical protein